MQVSGELKNKTIDFFRDSINGYYDGYFTTAPKIGVGQNKSRMYDETIMFYNGTIGFGSANKDVEEILETKQKYLISQEEEKIKEYLTKNYDRVNIKISAMTYDKLNINILIIKILNMPQFTYALISMLHKLVLMSAGYQDLFNNIARMKYFLDYLDTLDKVSQNDLDIMINLFLSHEEYNQEAVLEYKTKTYRLKYNYLDEDILKIVKFGEMVNPNRISIISRDLQRDEEASRLVAPIFFAIKSERLARDWLQLSYGPNFSEELIQKNIQKLKLPDNYLNLTRRL